MAQSDIHNVLRLCGQKVLIAIAFLTYVTHGFQPLGSYRQPLRSHTFLKVMKVWCDCRESSKCQLLEPPVDIDRLPDVLLMKSSAPSSSSLAEFGKHREIPIYVEDKKSRLRSFVDSEVLGAVIDTEDKKDDSGKDQIISVLGSVDWVLVESLSWLDQSEGVVAAAHQSGTKIAVTIEKDANIRGLTRAIELGVDAFCLSTEASDALWTATFSARRESMASGSSSSLVSAPRRSNAEPENIAIPKIVNGKAWRRSSSKNAVVLADRLCVDLVQRLSPTEGCWVGSDAESMALVLSEATTSQFVPSRPFRINAGPVHSCILMGDNKTTKYLCELEPSDQVLVYDSKTGRARSVSVGRVKEEVRPCAVVELETESKDSKGQGRGQIILQQAETVRLGVDEGEWVGLMDLELEGAEESIEDDKKSEILMRVLSSDGGFQGDVYDAEVVDDWS